MIKLPAFFIPGTKQLSLMLFYTLAPLLFLVLSCTKEAGVEDRGSSAALIAETAPESFKSSGLSHSTLLELMQARAATARYHNIANAFADGYANINVVIPNMGYHFMKTAWVDAQFEVTKPEILVYNKQPNGRMQLVAVEYAVPLSMSANAPAGFSGTQDVWTANTGFGLWLLHAWVWYENPDGVFNPTNAAVHLH